MADESKNRILKGFTLWPTIVMLSYFLQWWVLYYWDDPIAIQFLLFVIFMIIFPAVCFIGALVLLGERRPKLSLSSLTPALLVVFTFSSWSEPIRHHFIASRHYVEFQIQKRFYFPEMNEPDKLPPYKEWPLNKAQGGYEYTIIYNLKDSEDQIEKHKKNLKNGCGYDVTGVGKHFYMLEKCK
jgi:hypothetical protein